MGKSGTPLIQRTHTLNATLSSDGRGQNSSPKLKGGWGGADDGGGGGRWWKWKNGPGKQHYRRQVSYSQTRAPKIIKSELRKKKNCKIKKQKAVHLVLISIKKGKQVFVDES